MHQRSDSIFFVEQISHADMLLLGSICTSVAPAAALGQRQEALRPSGFYLFLWQSRRIKIGGTLFLLWDRSRQLFLSSLSAEDSQVEGSQSGVVSCIQFWVIFQEQRQEVKIAGLGR